MDIAQVTDGSSSPPPAAPFAVGENALRRIAHLLKSEPAGTLLRIAVDGGGCSGFQYRYDFETAAPAEEDLVIEEAGARVAVDATSLEFLRDARLEYVESLGGSAFEIKNPNTSSSCGCGNSFSVL